MALPSTSEDEITDRPTLKGTDKGRNRRISKLQGGKSNYGQKLLQRIKQTFKGDINFKTRSLKSS